MQIVYTHQLLPPPISAVILYLTCNFDSVIYKYLGFLSKYAFYIYMFQGFSIKNLFVNKDINDIQYVSYVILLSIGLAVAYDHIKSLLIQNKKQQKTL